MTSQRTGQKKEASSENIKNTTQKGDQSVLPDENLAIVEDMWTYLFQNPAQSQEEWSKLLEQMLAVQDRFHYAIVDKESGKALGTFALMRIDRNNRVIEVGAVTYSPKLKRTRLATEAQYLLVRYVFEELEYRRYEWKCDALNQPSRRAL